jgi:TIR domain
MKKVLISYRRDDAQYQALKIYEVFASVLRPENVFMDVASVPPGVDFVELLDREVGACDIVLALIGLGWLDAIDLKSGRRRVDNPSDFVRFEIGEALRRGILVVPVLLDDTPMPDATTLPEDLKQLVRRQAEFIHFRNFDADVTRLIKRLNLNPDRAERPRRASQVKRRAEQGQSHANRGSANMGDRGRDIARDEPARPSFVIDRSNAMRRASFYESSDGGIASDDRKAFQRYKPAVDRGISQNFAAARPELAISRSAPGPIGRFVSSVFDAASFWRARAPATAAAIVALVIVLMLASLLRGFVFAPTGEAAISMPNHETVSAPIIARPSDKGQASTIVLQHRSDPILPIVLPRP